MLCAVSDKIHLPTQGLSCWRTTQNPVLAGIPQGN